MLQTFLASLPKGARLTSRRLVKRGEIRVADNPYFAGNSENVAMDTTVELCWVGVPSTPDEFLERAVKAGHPRCLDVHVNEVAKRVVCENLIDPPYNLAKKRVSFFKHWSGKAKETSEAEQELRNSMPPHVRALVGNKRLVLFGKILESIDYPDRELISDIARGFPLHGFLPKSNVFPAKVRRPPMSMSTLKRLGAAFNEATFKALERKQDDDLEKAAWNE